MTTLQKLGCFALLSTTAIYADTIGGEVSLGMYSHSPSGAASYHTITTVDLEDDFKWSENRDIILKAYFEHPLPFIPNIKVAYTSLSHDGQGIIDDFSWGDISIPIDEFNNIETSLDSNMYDLTLYYELLDNWVEIDAGLTFRYLDGDVMVNTSSSIPFILPQSESVSFSEWIPMLYGKAKFNIPNTDISIQLEGNVVNYEDTALYDYELSARYTFGMGLGIEGGYKAGHIDSEELVNGLVVDMDFEGPYATVVWNF
jgi:outer membrane protein